MIQKFVLCDETSFYDAFAIFVHAPRLKTLPKMIVVWIFFRSFIAHIHQWNVLVGKDSNDGPKPEGSLNKQKNIKMGKRFRQKYGHS